MPLPEKLIVNTTDAPITLTFKRESHTFKPGVPEPVSWRFFHAKLINRNWVREVKPGEVVETPENVVVETVITTEPAEEPEAAENQPQETTDGAQQAEATTEPQTEAEAVNQATEQVSSAVAEAGTGTAEAVETAEPVSSEPVKPAEESSSDDEKAFVCPRCGKGFDTAASLRGHMIRCKGGE